MNELAVPESKTLLAIVDDMVCYTETLEMLDAQIALELPADERAEIEKSRSEVAASIQRIGAELADKTDAVAVVLRRLAHEREFVHEERDRLKAKESACERAEKWLRDYVVSVMQQNEVKQLRTATNTLFLRGSDAVEITDAGQIPDGYMNADVRMPLWLWKCVLRSVEGQTQRDLEGVRIHAEPSLSTIKKAIKSGVEVPGAGLRQNTSLVCR